MERFGILGLGFSAALFATLYFITLNPAGGYRIALPFAGIHLVGGFMLFFKCRCDKIG